ncbi:MAG: deoxyribonuclease IV [Solirubrobacterales bacterium]|nr:deoxyribonuclease IV [Solirubrobacterales bacterium]
MLIGAHVSPAGGLPKAIERGTEKRCQAIQIFNQSPRQWRPTAYGEDDFAAFRDAMKPSPIKAVLIHAVYLLNCASEDREIRDKSRASLIHSLTVGAGIGAAGVVLHPGSAAGRRAGEPNRRGPTPSGSHRRDGEVAAAIKRAGRVIAQALGETQGCPLHLEDTAGAGGTLGRSFAELAELLDAAGGDTRLGVCLDSCHLLASGYDIRTAPGLTATLDDFGKEVGIRRLRSLHLNDSRTPLGSNRDRHANIGEGELGESGCATFLSEPRFDELPCVLETPGPERQGPTAEEIALCLTLRKRGQASRKRAATRARTSRAKA